MAMARTAPRFQFRWIVAFATLAALVGIELLGDARRRGRDHRGGADLCGEPCEPVVGSRGYDRKLLIAALVALAREFRRRPASLARPLIDRDRPAEMDDGRPGRDYPRVARFPAVVAACRTCPRPGDGADRPWPRASSPPPTIPSSRLRIIATATAICAMLQRDDGRPGAARQILADRQVDYVVDLCRFARTGGLRQAGSGRAGGAPRSRRGAGVSAADRTAPRQRNSAHGASVADGLSASHPPR